MSCRKSVLILASTVILGMVDSCIKKQINGFENHENYWDNLDIKRTTDESCECGKFDHSNWYSPWNLYIHVKMSTVSSNLVTFEGICSGTIITSNLIVTSHKCLLVNGHRMRLYDILKLKFEDPLEKNMAGIPELTITNTKTMRPSTIKFTVIDIIYNPRYAMSSELKIYPENDLVLIKVAENFLKMAGPDFKPICVPFYDEKLMLGNMSGFYYGHTVDDEKTKMQFKMESDIPQRHFGQILEKRFCYEELHIDIPSEEKEASFRKTLCFKFEALEEHTRIVGGPLIHSLDGTDSTAFLLGVAACITEDEEATGYEASTGQENAYFSSIKNLIKFIEYFAGTGKDQSVWCKTPTDLNSKIKRIKVDPNPKNPKNNWPWDRLNQPIKRDENLDCVCGLPRSKSIGRIVGGSEVDEREYGWMAVLYLYHGGRGTGVGAAICGGSIINDRVILTAAHCVVNDDKIQKKERRIVIEPKNVVVILNAHHKHKDPEEIKMDVVAVLFHPNYYQGRNQAEGSRYYDTDIAMLILKDRINFAKNKEKGLRPICLPETGKYMTVVGRTATVAGWGLTDPANDYSSSDNLMHIDVPIQTLDYCRDVAFSWISDNFLCAGTLNRYKDAAKGDSGGPLMIQDNGQWYEIGLVSFGEDLDKISKTAALYSDVQKLLPFVDFHSKRVGARYCRRTP